MEDFNSNNQTYFSRLKLTCRGKSFDFMTDLYRLIKRDSASAGRKEDLQLPPGNSSVESESGTLQIDFKVSSDFKMHQE